jgi:hypothetical protein
LCILGLTGAVRADGTGYFSETAKDFGTTPRGPVLVHYFNFKNTTNQPMAIGQPRVSCGCVTAGVTKNQLAPGESAAISAFMDTRRIPVSNVQRTVTVYVPILAPQPEEVQLKVSAVARDDLTLAPDVLAFGTVRKGQGGKASTRVTFFSDPNWQITQAHSNGAYVKAGVKEVARQGNEVAYEVTATLDPACPVGNWMADVWVKTTAPGIEKLRIPVTVNVVSPIVVKPGAVHFGDVKAGEPVTQNVILQGNQAFQVLDIKGATDGLKVDAVGSGARPVHILKLTFTPKAAGDWSHALEIRTDCKEQPKVVVPLSATVAK